MHAGSGSAPCETLRELAHRGHAPVAAAAASALEAIGSCLPGEAEAGLGPPPIPADPEGMRAAVRAAVAGLEAIDELASSTRPSELAALGAARRELFEWLREPFEADPDLRRDLSDFIQSLRPKDIPWEAIRPASRGLALLYNFSPFQDTGATVASKRLRSFGASVDVIACSFLHKKKQDTTVEEIARPYVNRCWFLPLNPSWASWEPFSAFAVQASRLGSRFLATNGGYEFVYTRAMWAASHYAGVLFKREHPEVRWVAEFSDPMSLDVEGLPRGGSIPVDSVSGPLIDAFEAEYGKLPDEKRTIFAFAEYLAYAFADELLFTNANQLEVMLGHIHDERLRARVEERAVVSNHPTLPEVYYGLVPSDYQVRDDVVNLGYFGEFYSSRGITEVTSAMRALPPKLRERVELHVFTNYIPAGEGNRRPRQFSKRQFDELVQRAHLGVGAHGIEDQVRMNASLPYLGFLSTSDRLDYLIVNDARSGAHHAVNPYLPSKWSDYAGSSASSWAFVEDGSVLSGKPATVKTPAGDARAAREALWDMVVGKFPELEQEVAHGEAR